jgi:hypothetical protein
MAQRHITALTDSEQRPSPRLLSSGWAVGDPRIEAALMLSGLLQTYVDAGWTEPQARKAAYCWSTITTGRSGFWDEW